MKIIELLLSLSPGDLFFALQVNIGCLTDDGFLNKCLRVHTNFVMSVTDSIHNFR